MKKILLLPVLYLSLSGLSALADTTYTTINGTVNLVAGLSNLTVASAINSINQSTGVSYITDNSWSGTGIANLGSNGRGTSIAGSSLAGSFGGGTYFDSSNKIILIGLIGSGTTAWGSWTIRLLLSDGNYSSSLSFNDSNTIVNSSIQSASNLSIFQNWNGTTFSPGQIPTAYQEINIASFDSGNIGVTGIEISNIGSEHPDLTYIGVTAVPEPSALSLLAVGLGGLAMMRRRRS